jgi:DNA-binding response OmpR family regulator
MPKVLIIEDRRENIVFIANNVLKPMGYTISTARDGELGLQKAIAEQPDLIITDIKLPKMSGLAVLENLREQKINIPTIVMTFHGTEETAVRALRAGAKDYLIKPFTFDELQAALQRAHISSPPAQPGQPLKPVPESELEQQMADLRAELESREQQLAMLEKQSKNRVDKLAMAEIAVRAATWEEEGARLNEMLAQAKDAFQKEKWRTGILNQALKEYQVQLQQYRQNISQLAIQTRNTAEGLRLMAQNIEHQLSELVGVIEAAEDEAQP